MTAIIIVSCYVNQTLSAEVYKYQNDQGKWVFTDKKPGDSANFEKLSYESNAATQISPKTYITTDNNIAIINPFYIPIEVKFRDSNEQLFHHSIVAPNSTKIIFKADVDRLNYSYQWLRGDPNASHTNTYYHTPFKLSFKRKITQAFNGSFSHNSPGSQYAVDIALPVGTPIVAARAGVVIHITDNYVLSGRSKYFLDKANRVEVLHDDGTYATYAHLLHSSVGVAIGDTVTIGTELGKSGSSGFSTGPHLHFVIRKNSVFNTISVPFQFSDSNGNPYTPTTGQYILPNR
jgi:murein DD-endopeptidase MepM/ murein hydrolase activator NlpD